MSTLIRASQVSTADRMDFIREITAGTWVPMDAVADIAAGRCVSGASRYGFPAARTGLAVGSGDIALTVPTATCRCRRSACLPAGSGVASAGQGAISLICE